MYLCPWMHFFDDNSHWLDPKNHLHSMGFDSLLFYPHGTRTFCQVLIFLMPLVLNHLTFLPSLLKRFNMDYVNSSFSNFSACFIEHLPVLTFSLQFFFAFCFVSFQFFLSFSDITYVIPGQESPQNLSQKRDSKF